MKQIFFLFWLLTLSCHAQPPFTAGPLFDPSESNNLGLAEAPGTETFTIFSPDSTQFTYNHGTVLYPFGGKLYAMWQSSKKDEDAPDTQVYYSVSSDGRAWADPMKLVGNLPQAIPTAGGWWSNGDTLVAYICIWPDTLDPKQGHTVFMTSTDGLHWTERQAVTDKFGKPVEGIIEQDVHALPDGRLITAFHMQPGLQVTPFFSDHPSGTMGWTKGTISLLPSGPEMSREIEPSWFWRKDGAVVMIFRDQQSTFRKLASISYDRGQSWTTPTLIDTPDSRAKQSAGNLPDGSAFMVNNPSGSKDRFPLAVTLSDDGYHFDRAFLLRSGEDMPPLRFPGKYKRPGFSYPKSVVWNGYLYVGYATNKEMIQLTRIPVSQLSNQ